jgi:RNA polymerase II-associated protein 2
MPWWRQLARCTAGSRCHLYAVVGSCHVLHNYFIQNLKAWMGRHSSFFPVPSNTLPISQPPMSSSPGTRSLLEGYQLPLGSIPLGEESNSRARVAARRDPESIARRHAEILEYRKHIEAQILDSIIALSTYPLVARGDRGERYSAATPAPEDAAELKQRVRIFQPGDYDDLLEERNANGLCGYTLCAKPKPKKTPGGKWKLVDIGKKTFDIVDRKEHERWCSQICAKRGLYIKVQLHETAAWERQGVPDLKIDLYDEGGTPSEPPQKDKSERERNNEELARERGDDPAKGPRVAVVLRPKEAQPAKTGPAPDDFDESSHLAIEGYRPKLSKPKDA